jgi:hypothetical protein
MITFFRKIRLDLMAQNKSNKSMLPGSRYLKYAIGEIVLVVLGILIALQINTWKEVRQQAKEESSYLMRLLSENKQDIETFENNIIVLQNGIETAVNFSKALNNSNEADTSLIKRANDYFAVGSIYPIFTSSTSTFEDLSSTGNLKIISNTELRDTLVKHYAAHKQIAERIKTGNAWALPIDAPFTFKNNIMRFEPHTAPLYSEQSLEELTKELRLNKIEYISNAAVHVWINEDAIHQLEILINRTNAIIMMLQEALNTK